jgi:hypothetical protein
MTRYHTVFLAVALAVHAPGVTGRTIGRSGLPTLPSSLKLLTATRARPDATHEYAIVASASRGESHRTAHNRPLLIYRLLAGHWVLVGRNDRVVLRIDEGGQCDPFEGGRIVAKGRYFTVENAVGCGMTHFTDYVTFRFDPASGGYVFDNLRTESLIQNPSRDPDAEALISTGVRVTCARGQTIPFARWRRPAG